MEGLKRYSVLEIVRVWVGVGVSRLGVVPWDDLRIDDAKVALERVLDVLSCVSMGWILAPLMEMWTL